MQVQVLVDSAEYKDDLIWWKYNKQYLQSLSYSRLSTAHVEDEKLQA